MSNPFSTKFWTPGAIAYRFVEENESCDRLVDSFERFGGGQIVGPHGSGKSTLIESLRPAFLRRGYTVRQAILNDGNRRLPEDFLVKSSDYPLVRIVDGYERLRFFTRQRLRWTARGFFLIVTHRPVAWLPVLHRTTPDFKIFAELVRSLQEENSDETELRRLFEAVGGNFRDAFMELYDRAENDDIPYAVLRAAFGRSAPPPVGRLPNL